MENIQQTIRNLIAAGKTGQAIKTLMEYSKTQRPEWYNKCILLSSQFEKWREKNIIGLKTEQMELAQIEANLLALLDENPMKAEFEPVYAKESEKKNPENRKKTRSVLTRSLKVLVPVMLIVGVISAIFIWANPFKDKYTLQMLENTSAGQPNTYHLIDTVLISKALEDQSNDYLIIVKGHVRKSRDENIPPFYGKYWNTEDWYDDWGLDTPIKLEDENDNWSITFGHAHDPNQAKETFRFGLFERPGFKDDTPITYVEFQVHKN